MRLRSVLPLLALVLSACLEGGDPTVGSGVGGSGGRVDSLPASITFDLVSAGDGHSCALATGGIAWCWGSNAQGQLGDGTTTDATSPRRVASGSVSFASIHAGSGYTCALDPNGGAWCWGRNTQGQLGDGSVTSALTPVRVAGNRNWQSIAVGIEHSCGIAENGTAFCWGRNAEGQLGTGTTTASTVPVQVSTTAGLFSLQVGDRFTCALRASGQAMCWGSEQAGAPRLGSPGGNTTLPRDVSGSITFARLSLGNAHACGIESTAPRVSCWGGALAAGGSVARPEPTRLAFDQDVAALDAGMASSCLLTSTGRAWCWGRNAEGQLGNGGFTPSATPVAVRTELTFTTISVGAFHACALTRAREAWCWGNNAAGELGLGSVGAPQATPRRIP